MIEEEAIAWARDHVDATAMERLTTFVEIVREENERQNLVSPMTLSVIWSRHVVDSLQLVPLAQGRAGLWVDVGTGGGFPGMVVAIARTEPMLMVEPRRKRADFLAATVERLGLAHASVLQKKVEQVARPAAVISARAVATIENLLRAAGGCATSGTRWLLPRGVLDLEALATTAATYRMMFHVEQSLTQSDSSIVVLEAR